MTVAEITRRRLLQAGLGVAGWLFAPAAAGTRSPAGDGGPQAAAAGDLWRSSASDLADGIRRRTISSREVVEAHLRRIEAINPRVRAVTSVLADEALAAADEADRTLASGARVGPLHGVPMTVKENIDVMGSATTQGVPALAKAVPPVDAPRIAQLRRAGAIPIARTNLPDFGLRWHTDSGLHGPTINPWDASRTPGGSSGGDAAALATGMTPLGNGNDYGGSLRFPAQCCGVASIRPSRGRVAHHDALAPGDPPITLQLFAVEGPMARHVRDVRLALSTMHHPDARDPWWTPAPLEGPAVARPIRVAVTRGAGGDVHPDVADGVKRAAGALQDAGYAVEEVDPPAIAEAAMLWMRLVAADVRTALWPPLQPIVSADAARFMEQLLSRVPEIGLAEYVQGLAARNAIARRWSEFFERYPLVLGPVSTEPAFPVGRDLAGPEACWAVFESMRLVVLANLLGLPAAAVPVGVAGGLPQGVQVIGALYREDLCLDAAQAIEDVAGTITPIDPKG